MNMQRSGLKRIGRKERMKMSKYKIGDKVYLECEVSKIDMSDNTYRLKYEDYMDEHSSTYSVTDKVLHPADESYSKGLNDAWELAKKIIIQPDDGGYTAQELEELFRTIVPSEVFAAFTPQEALAKVKEYEDKCNEIKKGDVVKLIGSTHEAIVTRVSVTSLYFLFKDGSCGSLSAKEDFEKTSKHFDSIDEFMRSADD